MTPAPNVRLAATKAALWSILGAATTVGVGRYALGLGKTTALTDLTPWGLWIGFDVLAGVALAAGGFMIAGAVHVFHLERYHALLRPAVLTAFLGYVAVVVGLLIDLGKPWNIWRPTVFWQPHSALFEVAWCVMLYLTVLALEFAPVVAEGLRLSKLLTLLRRLTVPLVATGIALSTLHQSSLGTLLVIAPNRLHPLWYSPWLPLLFFVSAAALGLAMVTLESVVSSWLFHREAEWDLLAGLTRAAAFVLALYTALRVGDLLWRGQLGHLLDTGWWGEWFALELAVSAVVPALLFALPSVRRSRRALGIGAFLSVMGFVLYRVNAGGLSHILSTGEGYLPALTELVMSLGVVSAMALVFLFFVEHLRVWEHPPETPGHFRVAVTDPVSSVRVRAPWLGGTRRAAFAWALGGVLGLALLEAQVAHRSSPRPYPVSQPRSITAALVEKTADARSPSSPATVVPADFTGGARAAMLIDGDDDGDGVLFIHDAHRDRLGGEPGSCHRCHHRNRRGDRATSCVTCHRDMYAVTDTFDHERHVTAHAGNQGCRRCHQDPRAGKDRAGSAPCDSCHRQEFRPESGIKPASDLNSGKAAAYRDAMHGLCVECHRSEDARRGDGPRRSRCTYCHGAARASVATDAAPPVGNATGADG
ncbi:MAG: NrfD/PsrC family molybdoenzyme membrane anchor subunit [Acidobacteriota bacterium]